MPSRGSPYPPVDKSAARYVSWLPLIAIVVCVTLAHVCYVSLYSSDIPFWDQWDLLHNTLAPWWSGSLHWSELFAPHNEHRIAFTRLLSMGLLALNGGLWSNLVEAYTNTLLYGAVLALFYALACRNLARGSARILLAMAVVGIASLPFGWENILVGFQSQFYFMAGAAMLLIALAASAPPSPRTFGALTAVALVCLFTMASGVLAPLAAIAVLVLRRWRDPIRPRYLLVSSATLMLVAVIGLMMVPAIPGHAAFKAVGLGDHIHALLTFLIWPLQPLTWRHGLFLGLVWWPLPLWLYRYARRREAADSELFAVGILTWVLLQAAAFAHARGHAVDGLSSRYMDIPAIGLLANLALALHLVSQPHLPVIARRISILVISVAGLLTALVLVVRFPADLAAMRQRHEFNLVEMHYSQRYLQEGRPEALQHPSLMIPYINADKLQEFMDTPSIRALLPPVLQVPYSASAASPQSEGTSGRRGWLTHAALQLQRTLRRFWGVSYSMPVYAPVAARPPNLPSGSGLCHLDRVNDAAAPSRAELGSDDTLQLDGWVIAAVAPDAGGLSVVLEGEHSYQLAFRPNHDRPDVVRVMNSAPKSTYGISALGILDGVPSGDYLVFIATPGKPEQIDCHLTLHIAGHGAIGAVPR